MAATSQDKPRIANRPVSQDSTAATRAAGSEPFFDFLNSAFQNLIHGRQEKWNQLVAEALLVIRERAGEPVAEQILASEHFLTVITEATLVACRNHDEEKIRALRNAMLHTALSKNVDEPVQLMFLRLIDYLTPLHLVTVTLLNDPAAWMRKQNVPDPRWPVGTSAAVIQHCISALQGRPDIVEMIVRDLQGAGLVEQGYFLRIPMTDTGILQPHTTDSGRQFVRFISNIE